MGLADRRPDVNPRLFGLAYPDPPHQRAAIVAVEAITKDLGLPAHGSYAVRSPWIDPAIAAEPRQRVFAIPSPWLAARVQHPATGEWRSFLSWSLLRPALTLAGCQSLAQRCR